MNSLDTHAMARSTRSLAVTAIALLAGGLAPTVASAQDAQPSESVFGRFWGDFGIGYGAVDTSSAPFGDSSGGVVVDLTAGIRLSPRWRLGLNIGGAGSQIGNNNCQYQDYCNSIYGQSLTNVFAALEFEPGVDHGWLFGISAGHVLYDNRRLEDVSGNSNSGEGTGVLARIGYEWRVGRRMHLSAQLSGESAHVSLSDPFAGHFNSSIIGASFHVAYY